MAAMIWDEQAQAFREPNEVPMRYDPDVGAYVETTGKAYDPDDEAWTEKWNPVKVYGIQRDITDPSPQWERTGAAVGFTATASVGDDAGKSDFDNVYPWSGMVRETLSTGDVMVKIPAFYFRRYRVDNMEHIEITENLLEGFTLHPAFNHADVPKDRVYVGAYKTSSNNKSVSGATPQVSQTRATMRTNAKAKGTGWWMWDIAAVSAIQMLYLVEYATNDSQAVIGRGWCDINGAALSIGSCDSVPNLTGRPSGTDGITDVVYRGIEGIWGNVWEFVDGVNFYNGTYYVCNNLSKYADDTASNYTELSYNGRTNWTDAFITQEGIDDGNNVHVILPSAAESGSATTYECDHCRSSTGWVIFLHGGDWSAASGAGIFQWYFAANSSFAYKTVGSRLMYIPS
jgi:hypothetical protein